ncbi:MAG: glycosyl transferase [Clostridia bacterium]|nr:glycosyl transferase [Clostridia bacterium]
MDKRAFIHKFRKIYIPLTNTALYRFFRFRVYLPDRVYLEKEYKKALGYAPDLDDPRTFNEKLQWLKLYDRRDEYTRLVDKYAVRGYVKEKIGEEYLIPLIGVWDRPGDIDFDSLPESFVLKTNHDSGGVLICKDKETLNRKEAVAFLKRRYRLNSYWPSREWPYKNVKTKVIAEQDKVDSKTGELRDYKFFAFDGKVRAMFIASERQSSSGETKFDFFDENFDHLPFTNGHPNADVTPEKPAGFEKMIELAEILSAGIPQVRVDFYEADGRIYFGELTLFHWGGLVPFKPEEWDRTFGDWIVLPDKSEK